ncbi:hypothetical protein GC176_02265 [bacterium]|nr:hypothetical protein [bacterium]
MQRRLEHKLNAVVTQHGIMLLEHVCMELDADMEAARRLLQNSRRLQLFTAANGEALVASRSKGRPSDMAIARAVATQHFCHREPAQPRILSRRNIETYFPTLFRKGLPAGYYVCRTESQPVLGLLRVDTHAKPVARILGKSDSIAQRHFRQSEFRQLHRSGQFELTWLVPTEAKKRALEIAITTFNVHSFALRAFVVPELLELLAPLQTHHSPTSRV